MGEICTLGLMWRGLETEQWDGLRHRQTAKAAGNSYSPSPTATAPVPDPTSNLRFEASPAVPAHLHYLLPQPHYCPQGGKYLHTHLSRSHDFVLTRMWYTVTMTPSCLPGDAVAFRVQRRSDKLTTWVISSDKLGHLVVMVLCVGLPNMTNSFLKSAT